MTPRRPASILLLGLLTALPSRAPGDPGTTPPARRPAAILAPGVSDLHNSVLFRLLKEQDPAGLADSRSRVGLEGLETAGARMVFLSIGVPRLGLDLDHPVGLEEISRLFRDVRSWIDTHAPRLEFAPDRPTLDAILDRGHTGFAFALEGSHLLEHHPDPIPVLRDLGVRAIGIGHWFENAFLADPDAVHPVAGPRPLTDRARLTTRGRDLIERMIASRIRIDVSHLGEDAFEEIARLNADRTPLIASHANARALHPVPRNLTDRQILRIAQSGGLVGVVLHQRLLVDGSHRATVADVVDHIDHIRDRVGSDHVALGTDLEGGTDPPADLGRFDHLPRIQDELARRGYPAEEIGKIMWRNVTRILPGS